jgi:hypothetical protein
MAYPHATREGVQCRIQYLPNFHINFFTEKPSLFDWRVWLYDLILGTNVYEDDYSSTLYPPETEFDFVNKEQWEEYTRQSYYPCSGPPHRPAPETMTVVHCTHGNELPPPYSQTTDAGTQT